METVAHGTLQLVQEIKDLKNQIEEIKNEFKNNIEEHKDKFLYANNLIASEIISDKTTNTIAEEDIEKARKWRAVKKNRQNTGSRTHVAAKSPRRFSGCEALRGTGIENEDDTFAAVPRRLWLYVGRCDPATTEDSVQQEVVLADMKPMIIAIMERWCNDDEINMIIIL